MLVGPTNVGAAVEKAISRNRGSQLANTAQKYLTSNGTVKGMVTGFDLLFQGF